MEGWFLEGGLVGLPVEGVLATIFLLENENSAIKT
jgi:hypothetical protein